MDSFVPHILDINPHQCHVKPMSITAPLSEIDVDEAEKAALTAAIAEARTDPRFIPHEEMQAWLLRLAAGEFDAPPPEPRLL